MKRIVIAAAALLAAYSFLPTGAEAQNLPPPLIRAAPAAFMHYPWWAFACPGMIMFSAAVAAGKDGRELTYWEAYTCGVLYWFDKPPKQYIRKIKQSWRVEPVARQVG